jgi:ADP-ribose pyrophosphatase
MLVPSDIEKLKSIAKSQPGEGWKVLKAGRHSCGPRMIHVDEIESPDGAKHLTWTYFPGDHAVFTLALDDDDNALMVREYRHPLGREIYDLPAGSAHGSRSEEELLAHAARELAEETGFRASEWTKIGSFFPLPGGLSATFHFYVARGLEPIPDEEKGDGDEWSEIEEVVCVPFKSLHQAAVAGELEDGIALLAVLWAAARGVVRDLD